MTFRLKLGQLMLTGCFVASGIFLNAHLYAQTPPAAPPIPAIDPAQEASKRAFEALPDADRIAIQDGLIWTGDYKGIADGKFGKGTRDAIIAYATRTKLPTDGTLDTKGRAALAMTAKQAKENVRFLTQTDEKTGLRIALPLKLLTKTKPLPSGARYSSADESFSVETMTRDASSNLQDTYATLIADQPGRKVTYKVLRPDFFVVTGQTSTDAFYTRMARGVRAGNATLNGFTITYPIAAKARFDALSIAIANAFVPFPDASSAVAAPAASPKIPAAANSPTSAGSAPLTASGIVIAPGLILTSLPKTCVDPSIRAKKAKIMKQADTDGLTLLSLPDAPAAAVPLRASDPKTTADVVVLSFTSQRGNGVSTNEELIGAAGNLHKVESTDAWRLSAAVQNPVAGAAVLDRSGALAGLVPIDAKPAKPIAGILPEMSRSVILASKLAAFIAEARPKPIEHLDLHTTGEIVAMGRMAMVSVSCTP